MRRTLWAKIGLLAGLCGIASGATANALIDSAKDGDPAGVKGALARKVDVNAAEPDGTTALHWAVRNDGRETAGGFDTTVGGGSGEMPDPPKAPVPTARDGKDGAAVSDATKSK
jgi:hypothetical protein